MLKNFFRLFFPNLCCGCGCLLGKSEKILCKHREYGLPVTNFHLDRQNVAARQFWGRVQLSQVCSYLYFNKGSIVQQLLYQIKYSSIEEAAVFMGLRYGRLLMATAQFERPDLIVSVPLHQEKYRKRGYNQSDAFAQGMSEALNIPFSNRILRKRRNRSSQTLLNRIDRQENSEGVYFLNQQVQDSVKHILLVDDVLTTGATIEACVDALQTSSQDIRISVATLAYTK